MKRILISLIPLLITFPSRAEIGDLRSLAREIRFALADHGYDLTKAERQIVREDLVHTIRTIERITGRSANAGHTLEGLATSAQRLLDSANESQLRPATQRRIERRLARTAGLLRTVE